MTFPVKYEDDTSSLNFPTEGAMSSMNFGNPEEKKTEIKDWDYTDYEEDIYVGYRYFDTFNKQVSYPFGYGLSYTTFEYINPAIIVEDDTYTISIDIKNSGEVAGKEVVQLYVTAPNAAGVNKSAKELKAFAKTRELKPGETKTIHLTVKSADLASYDEPSSAWVTQAGEYTFLVGTSSRNIKATLQAEATASTEKTTDILKLQTDIHQIKTN